MHVRFKAHPTLNSSGLPFHFLEAWLCSYYHSLWSLWYYHRYGVRHGQGDTWCISESQVHIQWKSGWYMVHSQWKSGWYMVRVSKLLLTNCVQAHDDCLEVLPHIILYLSTTRLQTLVSLGHVTPSFSPPKTNSTSILGRICSGLLKHAWYAMRRHLC